AAASAMSEMSANIRSEFQGERPSPDASASSVESLPGESRSRPEVLLPSRGDSHALPTFENRNIEGERLAFALIASLFVSGISQERGTKEKRKPQRVRRNCRWPRLSVSV